MAKPNKFDPKNPYGKITTKMPAVVEKLNSKDAAIYEATETSPDKLRKSEIHKLALWCPSMEEARRQAKEMNSRVAFGRPKVSQDPKNPQSGVDYPLPPAEGPGAEVKQFVKYPKVGEAKPKDPGKLAWSQKVKAGIKASPGITWEATPGALILKADPETQAMLKELIEENGGEVSSQMEYDVLEGMFANSQLDTVRPEEVGALTDGLLIGDVDRDDQGNITEVHNIYWDRNYETRSFVQDLADKGEVQLPSGMDKAEPGKVEASIRAGKVADFQVGDFVELQDGDTVEVVEIGEDPKRGPWLDVEFVGDTESYRNRFWDKPQGANQGVKDEEDVALLVKVDDLDEQEDPGSEGGELGFNHAFEVRNVTKDQVLKTLKTAFPDAAYGQGKIPGNKEHEDYTNTEGESVFSGGKYLGTFANGAFNWGAADEATGSKVWDIFKEVLDPGWREGIAKNAADREKAVEGLQTFNVISTFNNVTAPDAKVLHSIFDPNGSNNGCFWVGGEETQQEEHQSLGYLEYAVDVKPAGKGKFNVILTFKGLRAADMAEATALSEEWALHVDTNEVKEKGLKGVKFPNDDGDSALADDLQIVEAPAGKKAKKKVKAGLQFFDVRNLKVAASSFKKIVATLRRAYRGTSLCADQATGEIFAGRVYLGNWERLEGGAGYFGFKDASDHEVEVLTQLFFRALQVRAEDQAALLAKVEEALGNHLQQLRDRFPQKDPESSAKLKAYQETWNLVAKAMAGNPKDQEHALWASRKFLADLVPWLKPTLDGQLKGFDANPQGQAEMKAEAESIVADLAEALSLLEADKGARQVKARLRASNPQVSEDGNDVPWIKNGLRDALTQAGAENVEHYDDGDNGDQFIGTLPNGVLFHVWLKTPTSLRTRVDYFDPEDEHGMAPPFEDLRLPGGALADQLPALIEGLKEMGSRTPETLEASLKAGAYSDILMVGDKVRVRRNGGSPEEAIVSSIQVTHEKGASDGADVNSVAWELAKEGWVCVDLEMPAGGWAYGTQIEPVAEGDKSHPEAVTAAVKAAEPDPSAVLKYLEDGQRVLDRAVALANRCHDAGICDAEAISVIGGPLSDLETVTMPVWKKLGAYGEGPAVKAAATGVGLVEGLRDMIEGGRLTEDMIPDDFEWLVINLDLAEGKEEGRYVPLTGAKPKAPKDKKKPAPKKPKAAKKAPAEAPPKIKEVPDVDFEEKAKAALAKHLNIDLADMPDPDNKGTHHFVDDELEGQGKVVSWGALNLGDGEGRDYVVYVNDDAAEEAAVKHVMHDLEEEPELFTQDWLIGEIPNGSIVEHFSEIVEEMVQSNVDDMDEDDLKEAMEDAGADDSSELVDKLVKDAGDPVDYVRDNFGEEEVATQMKTILNNLSGSDRRAIAQSAVDTDGAGHFLSGWDGELTDLGDGLQLAMW